MADCAGGGRGAMLAVLAPLEQVEAVVREDGLDLVDRQQERPAAGGPLRARPPRSRGPPSAFERRGITTRAAGRLGGLPQPVRRRARAGRSCEALDAVELAPAAIPVFANTTAAPYPDDPDEARALLAGQLARPVEFVAQVEAMYRSGVRTFLEVGPDAQADRPGPRRSSTAAPHAAIAVDASRGQRGNVADLACALAATRRARLSCST